MRLLDLFSGIGGFSLAAEWVWGDELEMVAFCEIEKYCQKVLQKNFPGVPIYEDITKLNGKDFKDIELLTGGFPCQDISVAGRGEGIKEGTRSGLWSEMHRIISEVQPRYALIENVPMLTIRGGTRVIADLTEIGYDTEWQTVGADDVGAWHKRKRIWIVAYPQCLGRTKGGNKQGNDFKRKTPSEFIECSKTQFNAKDVPDTSSTRRAVGLPEKGHREEGDTKEPYNNSSRRRRWTATDYWTTEPELGRVAHGIPSRVDRLKGLGNAIVPQVAALIMKRIKNETKTGR